MLCRVDLSGVVEGVGKILKDGLEAVRKSFCSSPSVFFFTAFVGVRFLADEVGVTRCARRRGLVGVLVVSGGGIVCDILAVVELEGAGEGNLCGFRLCSSTSGDFSLLRGGEDAFSTCLALPLPMIGREEVE